MICLAVGVFIVKIIAAENYILDIVEINGDGINIEINLIK